MTKFGCTMTIGGDVFFATVVAEDRKRAVRRKRERHAFQYDGTAVTGAHARENET